MMLYQLLYKYLNETFNKKIVTKTDKHRIGGQPFADNFYKVIISNTEVETKTMLAFIKIKLMNLNNKIQALNYDIEEFHKYINHQFNSLSSQRKVREVQFI